MWRVCIMICVFICRLLGVVLPSQLSQPLRDSCIWSFVWLHNHLFLHSLSCLWARPCRCSSKILFLLVLLIGNFFTQISFPSFSSLHCRSFISFAQSQILLSISLFLFFSSSSSSLSQAFFASLFSLPFTPSQDKQPLFWGMSAICSKKLTSFWIVFSAGSLKGGKITNLVPFHNLSLCFSFFLVHAVLFFLPPNSLTTCSSLAWNLVIPRFVRFDALPPLRLTLCSSHAETSKSPRVCYTLIYSLWGTFITLLWLTQAQGEDQTWEQQFPCLWAACVKSLWESHIHTHIHTTVTFRQNTPNLAFAYHTLVWKSFSE